MEDDKYTQAQKRVAAVELLMNQWPITNQEVKAYLEAERANLIEFLEYEEHKLRA